MTKRSPKMHAEILAVLEKNGSAMSAYDILSELRGEAPKLAPPTIYRALTALTADGRVHRLESQNAFIACKHEDHDHTAVMSICDDCGAVEETSAPGVLEDLSTVASQSGFVPTRHVVEIIGQCGDCAEPEAKS